MNVAGVSFLFLRKYVSLIGKKMTMKKCPTLFLTKNFHVRNYHFGFLGISELTHNDSQPRIFVYNSKMFEVMKMCASVFCGRARCVYKKV